MRSLTLPSRLARTGCSVIALATVLVVGARPAAAQSFLGTGNFTTNGGGVAGIGTGPGSTTITVNSGQTVIDWIPTDNAVGGGAIGFQLGGTTATFTGASNFAVLNNITQADLGRAISMNGTINSLVGGVQGGSVYFYSAGGFVLGQNSLINVGSLVLSASPITVSGGNFITGASNSVTFGQTLNASARIITTLGSQINANASDAYVAMVAPRVQHGGAINVSGSAALVGAEAAIINFSPDGLFNIQVTSGTTDANGVSSNGTITGSASTGANDIHRAYMVAVPKNAALTMVIAQGGSLGFDIAGAEAGFPAGRMRDAFDFLSQHFMPVTVHAGEADGLGSIRGALFDGRALRLGHGVRLAEDIVRERADNDNTYVTLGPIAQWVKDREIALELSPSSNLQTGAIAQWGDDLLDHPFDVLYQLGFRVTVNTDNRLMSNTTLSRELALLSEAFGYSLSDLETFQLNAAAAAFLPLDEREDLADEIIAGFGRA